MARPKKYPYPIADALEGGSSEEPFMTVDEVAVYLRTTTVGVYNLVSRKKLPAYKPFNKLLFKKSELDLIVESSRKRRGFHGN